MKRHRGTTWLALCVAMGASLGAATGEMGFWVAMGAGIGAGLMSLAGGRDMRCSRNGRGRSPRE